MPAEVEKGKCLRRYRQQDCTICQNNCPGQAIDWKSNLPVLDTSNCQSCGFCRAQCPTAAFSGPNWVKSSCLACQETGPVEGAAAFPCLATISPEDVLSWLVANPNANLEVHCGDCNSCNRKQWAVYADKSKHQIKDWLRAAGWQQRCQFKYSPREIEVNRRALFSWLGFRLLEKVEKVLEPGDKQQPRSGWASLLACLPECTGQRSADIPRITVEKCTLCQVCSRACPQQALQLVEDEKQRSLTWNGIKCHDCRVCSDLCPERALSWQPGLWKERREPVLLQQKPLLRCRSCGQVLTSGDRENCHSCRRQQELLQEIQFTFTQKAGNRDLLSN